ncbi:MAG: MBL fold metallo-hydrolase [Actinomycetota bacterium]|nr:MBL fold metallo-hydrolase [Actinomycetota bacterium]
MWSVTAEFARERADRVLLVRITVLGKSPSWQDVGGACSGYLVQDDQTCLLLDCGNGVFSKLRRFRDYVDVDAVVVSHMHADHFLDLVPFSYALTYAPRQQPVAVHRWPGTETPARPRLFVPAGAPETLRRIVGCWGNADLIDNAFRVEEYDPGEPLQIASLHARFRPVPHFTPTNAVELTSTEGGGRFTYGADHRPTDALCGFADDTDLLLLEATLPRPEREGPRGHLTPAEAGEHAAKVNAARLVLTHISDELDPAWAQAEARRAFAGPIEVAREGAVYEV